MKRKSSFEEVLHQAPLERAVPCPGTGKVLNLIQCSATAVDLNLDVPGNLVFEYIYQCTEYSSSTRILHVQLEYLLN